jgi:Na+/melibiose symporter-like transporter
MVWYFADYHINSPILVLALLALGALPVLLSIVAIVRIVQRAGFSGWWTLFILVPVVNMAALWYFAFADWPVTRQTRSPQF